MDSLGIDSRMDGEVYHNARLASGFHDYGGWFHCVGALAKTGDFPIVELAPGFTLDVQIECPIASGICRTALVQIEFHMERVPWMLDEASAI